VNLVRGVLGEIVARGRVIRGWIGIVAQDIEATQAQQLGLARGGVVLTNFYVGSPALQSGLRPGDLVLAVGGSPVDSAQETLARIARTTPGTKLRLQVQRGTRQAEVTVLVSEPPRSI
jgi:serine protease DegS